MSQEQLERWEDRTTTPLVVIALLFLGAYAWPILDADLPTWATTLCTAVSVVVWVLLALDLLVRLRLAPDNLRFLRRNWLDVVTLAVPMLRPLRVLRVLLVLNVLGRRGRAFLRGQVVGYVVAAVGVISGVAALAVLDAERDAPGANILTFGDALWWAVTTVTTVGYGDRYPVTGEGRLVAVGLMLTGIALLGVITAALASWFVEQVTTASAEVDARQDQEVESLAAEVHALRADIAAIRRERDED